MRNSGKLRTLMSSNLDSLGDRNGNERISPFSYTSIIGNYNYVW